MSVVQYYNTAAMYRHPQAMSAAAAVAAAHQGHQFYNPNNAAMHGWYAGGYHHGQAAGQMGQPPATYCMQEEQQMAAAAAWHANQHSFQQDFQDFFGHNSLGQQAQCETGALPSPPITVSGSEMSSPGVDGSSPNQHSNHHRPPQVRSPYEWIKKNSYQNQPLPGKTRTKDKYRVVYTDHQRVELEKEFYYSRYITIRRKAELAANLGLSERQVKIWFQNRRAKERKQVKKREEVNGKDSNNLQVHPQTYLNTPIVQHQPPVPNVPHSATLI